MFCIEVGPCVHQPRESTLTLYRRFFDIMLSGIVISQKTDSSRAFPSHPVPESCQFESLCWCLSNSCHRKLIPGHLIHTFTLMQSRMCQMNLHIFVKTDCSQVYLDLLVSTAYVIVVCFRMLSFVIFD